MIKKILAVLLIGTLAISLTACGNSTTETSQNPGDDQVTQKDSKTLIFESEDVQSALGQFKELIENAETEEEKEEIEIYMSEYFLQDLNGYLYFINPEHKYMHVESDDRAIYVVSKDEVYVAPYSEQEMQEMQLDLEDLPTIENSELYKYHISEMESGTRTIFNYSTDKEETYYYTRVLLVSDYFAGEEVTRLNSMDIDCAFNSEHALRYNTNGYFADEADLIPDYDRDRNYGAIRTYYRDENSASSAKVKQDRIDEEWMTELGWIEDDDFSNNYGSSSTKCVVSGCSNNIASSGDTNCCTTHSNNCLECGCYIDGDAMYCMECLTEALQ